MATVASRTDRRTPRVPVSVHIRLLLHEQDPKPGHSARTVDLSERGMRIRTAVELSEGQQIRIDSWGESGKPMPCRVVWTLRTPAGESQAGMEFLGVSEA